MSDVIASLQRYADCQAANSAQIASRLSMSADEIRLLLERITQLEADNALLRTEVRSWRALALAEREWNNPHQNAVLHEVSMRCVAAREATDAAGVLER